MTHRFPDAPETHEQEWQELVVAHLELGDWERVESRAEFDVVGPVAAEVLHRHGVVAPQNAHFLVPFLKRAGSGSVVTGVGGDLFLGGWYFWPVGDLLGRRRRRPVARDGLRLAHAAAPASARRAYARRRRPPRDLPWLTAAAQEELAERQARHLTTQPVRFDAFVRWGARRRAGVLARRVFARLAGERDSLLVHPLSEPLFLASLAADGGRDGYGDRTAMTRRLADGALPGPRVTRDESAVPERLLRCPREGVRGGMGRERDRPRARRRRRAASRVGEGQAQRRNRDAAAVALAGGAVRIS